MKIPKEKPTLSLILLLVLFCSYILHTNALTEEIEATPTNTNGIEIGELSMPQYMMLMLIFLKFVLLYAVGVLPLEIDLGGVWDPLSVDASGPLFNDGPPGPVAQNAQPDLRINAGRSIDNYYKEFDGNQSTVIPIYLCVVFNMRYE